MPRATAFTRVLPNDGVLDTRRFCWILVAQEMRAAIATVIGKGSSCFLSRGVSSNTEQSATKGRINQREETGKLSKPKNC